MGLLVLLLLVMSSNDNGGKRKAKKAKKAKIQHGIDDEYSIKGINRSGITDKYLGDFDGVAEAVTGNSYDPYAVSIYVGKKRVGWLPAGCVDVHAAIMEQGGSIDVHVYIGKAVDEDDGHEFYFGKVRPGL